MWMKSERNVLKAQKSYMKETLLQAVVPCTVARINLEAANSLMLAVPISSALSSEMYSVFPTHLLCL